MQEAFGFKRLLMINPPLNLLHGVQVLDEFSRTPGLSFFRKLTVGLPLRRAVARHRRIVTTEASQRRFYARVRLNEREKKSLIGDLLMSSLPRTIAASQTVRDLGVLAPASQRRRVFGIDFEDYIMRFYRALARRENRAFSEAALNAENSLYRLAGPSRSTGTSSLCTTQMISC